MNRLLLMIVLFFAGYGIAGAQVIHFTDTANRWKLWQTQGIYGESRQDLYTLRLSGDTMVGGRHYRKTIIDTCSAVSEINGRFSSASCMLGALQSAYIGRFYREDTGLQQVFCINRVENDSTEHLIYNRAWKAGDTLRWGTYRANGTSGYSVVRSADSVLINGSWHKIFHMSGPTHSYDIIEGIGSTKGLAFPSYPWTFENDVALRCFTHAGYRPAINPALTAYSQFDNNTTCAKTWLGIADESRSQFTTAVVPNPADQTALLQLPPSVRSGSVQLFDATGRVLASITFRRNSAIPIGAYFSAPGVYYYRFQDEVSGQRSGGHFTVR